MSLGNHEFQYYDHPYINQDIDDLTNASSLGCDDDNFLVIYPPIDMIPSNNNDNQKSSNDDGNNPTSNLKTRTPSNKDVESKFKRKRNRRTATEIQRLWKCNQCEKAYGSEGALKTHRKLKHPNTRNIEIMSPFISNYPGVSNQMFSTSISIDSTSKSIIPESGYLNFTDIPKTLYKNVYIPQYHGLSVNNLEYGDLNQNFSSSSTNPISSTTHESSIYNHEFISEDHIYVPISLLMIGEYILENSSNNLFALFSYSTRTIYWKKRNIDSIFQMEISFDDIMNMRIEYKEETAIFHVYLYLPPRFWIGLIPLNEANIFWKPTKDFTEGYATRYLYHIVHFPKYLITKPLEKLLAYDFRIRSLVESSDSIKLIF